MHLTRAAALLWLLPLAACGDISLTDSDGTTGILDVDLGKIAVVTGDYERVEELLVEVGAVVDLYDGFIDGPPEGAVLADTYAAGLPTVESLLTQRGALLSYDTVLLNCGIRGAGAVDPVTLERDEALIDRADVRENLRAFVASGGALYVSDQSYTLVEASMPEALDFQGADEAVGAALVGVSGGARATVVLPALAETLPGPVDVELPPRWAAAHPADGAWLEATTLLSVGEGVEEAVEHTPLLVRAQVGGGQILFSSFHNTPEVDEVKVELGIQLLRGLGGAL